MKCSFLDPISFAMSGRPSVPPVARIALFTAVLILAILVSCTDENGAGPGPDGPLPAIELELVEGGFSAPVQVAAALEDTSRLFVVEQAGIVRIIKNGTVLPLPFLDIRSLVLSGGERGLLSIAFPPRVGDLGHFYVDYTRAGDGATVVARYRVDPGNPDDALETSAEVLLVVSQPYSNHNGGMIAFGPDGYLYIALGDGGGGGDPGGNGQNPGTLLGAILRIDVESGAGPYGIPGDNPFVGRSGFREEIWAMGLRNPWRFSFDRATGNLYIADVGQSQWEEIDFQLAVSRGGENYGWNIMEGAHCYNAGSCDRTGLVLPVHEYDHGQGCSITGGYVYRGALNPALRGVYLFGDYCSGTIWGLRRSGGEWKVDTLLDTQLRIVSFGEDAPGEVYVVEQAGGIYRIRETSP